MVPAPRKPSRPQVIALLAITALLLLLAPALHCSSHDHEHAFDPGCAVCQLSHLTADVAVPASFELPSPAPRPAIPPAPRCVLDRTPLCAADARGPPRPSEA